MPKNKEPIPEEFKSIDEVQQFWDDHSTADHWDEMEDVDFGAFTCFEIKT